MTIDRNGTADISPLTDVHNNHIYKGSENELILARVYTASFICEFALGSYPFDFQKCSMIFVMQVLTEKSKKITEAVEVSVL